MIRWPGPAFFWTAEAGPTDSDGSYCNTVAPAGVVKLKQLDVHCILHSIYGMKFGMVGIHVVCVLTWYICDMTYMTYDTSCLFGWTGSQRFCEPDSWIHLRTWPIPESPVSLVIPKICRGKSPFQRVDFNLCWWNPNMLMSEDVHVSSWIWKVLVGGLEVKNHPFLAATGQSPLLYQWVDLREIYRKP